MTPPLLREAFATILQDMRWQLADATPRRILHNAGFMTNLRRMLQWGSRPDDPPLSELHPSLGNLDHVAYLINDIRQPLFPQGTDFHGAQDLLQQHLQLPVEQQYIRYAEELQLPGSAKRDRMVICMFPEQSQRLLDSKRVEVDIAFKRVTSWYEFEMVAWDDETCRSMTLCRAFLTSMTAEAHLALYRQIFAIAEKDTGRKPRFHHLHGDGFEVWTADDDKGHALGLGKFLQELAQSLDDPDRYEPHKRLCDLTPYEHLARFLRLCLVHFKRNIKKLEHRVTTQVYQAMLSLAACETHADFNGACTLIRSGGKAAANWLKEKELFGLAALYHPLSKIPLELWLAGNPTTNGVEQKHRDINRDGKGLTLLGGINRGMQHDIRERSQAELARNEGVDSRYKTSTPAHRQYRRIQRAIRTEKRKLLADGDSGVNPPKAKRSAAAPTARAVCTSSSTAVNNTPSYLTTVPIPVHAEFAQPSELTE
ncbi:hypothetical protein AURDEDRAFT_176300 [Auricularia subglabra TFB-10046 SS5]|uniref:MULE transposase domain-containing protein n=1 Tax=Auricularia subglabra (strain TFB-10046 / SS5) TaxID=717982 RepID=J0LDG5_AURST|nr:hypothetical protein AURDEDRAFT_176300 [Auricularia subglabra TFB-10046 SS5]